jgi:lipoyl(octanoyl) transferase
MSKPKFNHSAFGLKGDDLSWLNDWTLVVRKWNWDYERAWTFQRSCVDILQEHPRYRVLVCCSHPRVFTNGRGLQRPRKGEVLELKQFTEEERQKLPFPFFQIERGGGLTFHHPGQFIFYPIVKLHPSALSLSRMTNEIFDYSAEVLTSWGLTGLSHEHELMGLWHNERKMASMGIAITRLTTFHGMALNLKFDPEMKKALQLVNPCGLDSSTYISAEELISLPENALDRFTEEFLKKVAHGWQ